MSTTIQNTVLIALAFVLIFLPATATGQVEISHHATASPQTVSPGESLRYRVEVSVTGNYEIQLRKQPGLSEFAVRGRTSMPSTIAQDRQTRRRLTLEYILRAPDRAGRFEIEPPEFVIGQQVVVPDPVTVRIVSEEDLPRHQPSQTDRSDQRAFVDISIEPQRDPYVGEQIVVRYDLYVDQRHRALRPRPPDDPPLDDFWVEELTENLRLRQSTAHRYGRNWLVAPLRVAALFPMRSGSTEIDGLEVNLVASGLFGGTDEDVAIADSVPIEVQPLPPGAPDSFSPGNVGNWSLDVSVDSNSARVGGHLTVTARITGIGRPGRIGAPLLDTTDAFRLVSTTDNSEQVVRQGRLQGHKTFEFNLMPLKEGRQKLPPLEFSYFDPDRGEYLLLTSDPIELNIEEGTLPVAVDENGEALQRGDGIDDPLDDLRGLAKPGTLSHRARRSLPFSPWLILVPLAALLVLFVEPKITSRIAHRLSPLRRRRRLRKQAARILADEEQPLAGRCLRALRFCLNEGIGCRLGALTVDDVDQALSQTGVEDELRDHVVTLVDHLISLRYAPRGAQADAPAQETSRLIDRLLTWRFGQPDDGPDRTDKNDKNDGIDGEKSRTSSTAAAGLILFGFCGLIALAAMATPAEAFAEEEFDWPALADEWTDLAIDSPDDPTAQYNAGTAAAFAGDLGRARLYLERAVALGADDSDLRHNLAAVTASVSAKNPSVAAFYQHRPAALAFRGFAPWLIVTLLWLAAGLALLRRITGRPACPIAFRTAMTVFITAALLVSTLWISLEQFSRDATFAVVLDDGQVLQEAPSRHAARAYDPDIPAGAVVRLKQKRDGWTEVVLPSRTRGWLPTASVEEVEP